MRIMRYASGFLTALPLLALASTNNLVKGNLNFSENLSKQYVDRDASQNFLVSSKNVADAMALLLLGTEEKTATESELKEVLGISSDSLGGILELGKLNQKLTEVHKKQRERDPSPTNITVATSLWANELVGFEFKDNYVQNAKNWLGSEVKSLDFSQPSALTEINSWVSTKTQGMIPNLLSNLPKESASVLISTLFVEGAWREVFKDYLTKEEDFTLLDGKTKKLKMMKKLESELYHKGEVAGVGYQMVKLDTADGLAAMEIYLPESLEKSQDFRTAFLNGQVQLPAELTYEEVDLKLPRFKVSFRDNSMEKTLLPLLPHTLQDSDFTEIGNQRLEISQIVHEAVLEVQEMGFRAAAATAVVMRTTSMPVPRPSMKVHVNRPFAVKIKATIEGKEVELFRGWVANPEVF